MPVPRASCRLELPHLTLRPPLAEPKDRMGVELMLKCTAIWTCWLWGWGERMIISPLSGLRLEKQVQPMVILVTYLGERSRPLGSLGDGPLIRSLVRPVSTSRLPCTLPPVGSRHVISQDHLTRATVRSFHNVWEQPKCYACFEESQPSF